VFGWLYRTMAETRIPELLDAKQSRISCGFQDMKKPRFIG